MSRFRFEVATPADDADLRHVLAATPMPGHISVSFRREPSWFDAAVVDGHFRQVIACRDLETGRLFGFGCRSIRRVYANGEPSDVGYLSSLRVLPQYRNQGLVARGYAFMRRLHQDGRASFYLTTIAEGNSKALEVLTSGRAGLPRYHPAGRYHTLALTLASRKETASGVEVRPATDGDLEVIVELLTTVGPRRQFFPCYDLTTFRSPDGPLRGLRLDQVLLAWRAGTLVGLLAGWDQSAYRQSVVHAYTGWMKLARPFYNVWQRLCGQPGLPAAGKPLGYLTGALPVVADDDPGVFRALLAELRRRSRAGPWSHLLVGLHESDPLFPIARRLTGVCYTTLLYLACWDDGEARRTSLDARPVYLELGSL